MFQIPAALLATSAGAASTGPAACGNPGVPAAHVETVYACLPVYKRTFNLAKAVPSLSQIENLL